MMFAIRFLRGIFTHALLRSALCLALGWLIFAVVTDSVIVMYDTQTAFHPFSAYDWYRLFGGASVPLNEELVATIRTAPILVLLAATSLFYRSRFGHALLVLNSGYLLASLGVGYRMYGERFRLGHYLDTQGEWAVLIGLFVAMTVPYWKLPHLPKRMFARQPKPQPRAPLRAEELNLPAWPAAALDLAPYRMAAAA